MGAAVLPRTPIGGCACCAVPPVEDEACRQGGDEQEGGYQEAQRRAQVHAAARVVLHVVFVPNTGNEECTGQNRA